VVFFTAYLRRSLAVRSGSSSSCRRNSASVAASAGSDPAKIASAPGSAVSIRVPDGSTNSIERIVW